ncbi:MAG TPA: LysM peptidoglycan-binding domain-containing protein [Gemmatimonadales bacterium]|nr:LysM peptidoglycan-binding domain-containing protein [Gemmatimonadales bacterium]
MTGSNPSRLFAVFAALALPSVVLAQTPRPDSHEVRPGDTLWDLSRQYFGDPFLWPEIYRLNTNVVEDPHWIYPGEVLRLQGGPEVAAVPSEDTPVPPEPGAPVSAEAGSDSGMAGAPADSNMAEPGLAEAQVGELQDTEPERDADDLSALFGHQQRPVESGIEGGISRLYRPIREDEFYSSGFLSEEQKLPFGQLLGSVTPQQISTSSPHKGARIYSEVGIRPPAGAKYEVGDTLLIVRIDREINDWGLVLVPTGLIRVTDVGGPEDVGVVVQQYAQILNNQFLLPAEKFPDPGSVRSVPISDGVHGQVIQSRDLQQLKGPLDVLFIDRGRKDGVNLGDIFEVRSSKRYVEAPQGEAETLDEVMALVQVVHVGEQSSSVRIAKLIQPNIRPGAGVRQVAKLPS